jgi:biopolymer transport protein ExbB
MNLTQKFLAFTLLGAQWVLWLLIGLSFVSVAIMIERLIFFFSRLVTYEDLVDEVKKQLKADGVKLSRFDESDAMEILVARAGLAEAPRGSAAAAEAMASVRTRQRARGEANLAVLGTLGNNAPFIGLFGTVLGIIKAFHDLSENSDAGAKAVMAGISEALVATAVGLMVAIPAVLMFNFFQRRVRTVVSRADSVAHVILTELRAREAPAPAPKQEAA